MKIPLARVEVLVWVLIYAGLLLFGLGLALREFDAVLGHALWIVGLAVAAGGVVLIAVRARMVTQAADAAPPNPTDFPR